MTPCSTRPSRASSGWPEIVIPFASSLAPSIRTSSRRPKMGVVARSTPRSVVETGDTVDLKLRSAKWTPRRAPGPKGSPIAAAAGRDAQRSAVPERRQDEASMSPEKSAKTSRDLHHLVLGGFLTNPFARAGNGGDDAGSGVEHARHGPGRGPAPARRALRAQQALTQSDPRVQEHARLAHRRHRLARRLGEDHPGPEPSSEATSRSPASATTTATKSRSASTKRT